MKKIVICFLLVLVIGHFGNAQSGYGSKLGANLGWIGGQDWVDLLEFIDDTGNPDPHIIRVGLSFGIYLTIGISKNLAIQPEILLSDIGGNYKYTYLGYKVEGSQWALAFEIPLYLKPRFSLGLGSIYFLAGPEMIVIIGDVSIKEKAIGITVEVFEEPDNRLVWGISAGLGYEFPAFTGPIIKGNISIEAKYTRQLTEIFEDSESFINAITFLIGYGSTF